jgi:hypothetical protein
MGVPVGRRGEDQRHMPGEVIEHAASEATSIVLNDECLADGTLAASVLDVPGGERRPPWLELDADRSAIEMACLDKRRRDPAHRIEHEVPGVAVRADRTARYLGQHLRRVTVGLRQKPAASLNLRAALRAGPNRRRQIARPRRRPMARSTPIGRVLVLGGWSGAASASHRSRAPGVVVGRASRRAARVAGR